ncbi:MAG: multifunctional oxoglutarate decarboxylase/oxoglutarate dehydrogenase thiamine pyrophosphate-binding subunit/dihydrolipoyllysine-residue succinyltransferase subunit [Candidatus Dormibacteria bacterium]
MPDTAPILLPALGESVTEGIVARWAKQVGDPVLEGETVVEVTTDKVDIEVPSPITGVLSEISAQEGNAVPVGGRLGLVEAGAPSRAAAKPRAAESAPLAPASGPPPAARVASAPPRTAPAAAPTPAPAARELVAPTVESAERIPPPPPDPGAGAASPLARRAAAIAGIDLRQVRGTGPGGMVRGADVEAAARAPRSPAKPPRQTPPPHRGLVPSGVPLAGGDAPTQTPLRGPSGALVDAMERSLEIPTATSFRTIPVAHLDARRRQLNAALSRAGRDLKISYTHLIGYALTRAAGEMPQMCAHLERDDEGRPVRVENGVHLGLAVDSRRKDGSRFLVVPVIRDAAALDFVGFHAEYERLVELARGNRLAPDDLRGATLTLTNPGGLGTMASVPRLMSGQGCIVAAGAIGYPPEYRHLGEAELRQRGVAKVVTLTSTYDHRIIQGAESGEFLGRIEALLSGADAFYTQVFDSLGLDVPVDEISALRAAAEAQAASLAPAAATEGDRALVAAIQAATSLVQAHRTHGHLGASLDPLGTPPPGDPALRPETYDLTPEIMERIPADLLNVHVPGRTLAEVLPNLRRTYCGTIAYEIEHISSHEQRLWLREHIESGTHRLPLAEDERLRLLWRLTKVDAMERYFRRAFLGQKTFSGEGVDMLVPMLEKLFGLIADDGTDQVVMGMAHRGRLAVIAHVVNRPYEQLLQSFERGELRPRVSGAIDDPTGDVKYHLGATGTYITDTGLPISVRLVPNPSHLEAVGGVVEGWTRALQSHRDGASIHLDTEAAIPILIHGDASFSGEGAVQEVLNLQSLAGYTTGGTIHIIVDNQVGFTTDPGESRSTRYASDLAKGFDIPIVHINADDPEACITAVRLAHDYRRIFHRDIVMNLIGYRRFGHNETDEPSYTQPVMYRRIREHPTVRALFVRQLVGDGLITAEEAARQSEEVYARIGEAHKRVKANLTTLMDEDTSGGQGSTARLDGLDIATSVPEATLRAANDEIYAAPDGFTVNRKLARQLETRRASLSSGTIDYGHAEALAIASLLLDGIPVRLTGQDTARGTFSHRHMVLHDELTGDTWVPLQHLSGAAAALEVHNSPLSEVGPLAFEYGFSAADPACLVVWEAQFGDFANNAQMVIDQFIVAAQAKWGQRSRLVLLLPHGYEGQGPEHSSARVERYLQLAAHGNIRVANCTTSGQYFHLLRNQALATLPRPLMIMTPKSGLRAQETSSRLADLTGGAFRAVIDDARAAEHPERVRTLLLCTGKIHWELQGHELREHAPDLAIARVELLDPLPLDEILELVAGYPNLERLFWVQEEPRNMGAWGHVQRPIGLARPYEVSWEYIGRPGRASPSEGYKGSHVIEQERIIREALLTSPAAREFVATARPRLSTPGEEPSGGNGHDAVPAELAQIRPIPPPRRSTAARRSRSS